MQQTSHRERRPRLREMCVQLAIGAPAVDSSRPVIDELQQLLQDDRARHTRRVVSGWHLGGWPWCAEDYFRGLSFARYERHAGHGGEDPVGDQGKKGEDAADRHGCVKG